VKGYSGFERITKPLPPVNIALHQISDPTSILALPWFGLASGFNVRGATDGWVPSTGGFNIRADSTCERIQHAGGFNVRAGSEPARTHVNHHHFQHDAIHPIRHRNQKVIGKRI